MQAAFGTPRRLARVSRSVLAQGTGAAQECADVYGGAQRGGSSARTIPCTARPARARPARPAEPWRPCMVSVIGLACADADGRLWRGAPRGGSVAQEAVVLRPPRGCDARHPRRRVRRHRFVPLRPNTQRICAPGWSRQIDPITIVHIRYCR